jgi:hypothetical protein
LEAFGPGLALVGGGAVARVARGARGRRRREGRSAGQEREQRENRAAHGRSITEKVPKIIRLDRAIGRGYTFRYEDHAPPWKPFFVRSFHDFLGRFSRLRGL